MFLPYASVTSSVLFSLLKGLFISKHDFFVHLFGPADLRFDCISSVGNPSLVAETRMLSYGQSF